MATLEAEVIQKGTIKDWKQLPVVLEPKHLSLAMGIGINAAYDLMHSKGFPTVNVGNRLYVGREAFRVWLVKRSND